MGPDLTGASSVSHAVIFFHESVVPKTKCLHRLSCPLTPLTAGNTDVHGKAIGFRVLIRHQGTACHVIAYIRPIWHPPCPSVSLLTFWLTSVSRFFHVKPLLLRSHYSPGTCLGLSLQIKGLDRPCLEASDVQIPGFDP